jgi:hypothetical protein
MKNFKKVDDLIYKITKNIFKQHDKTLFILHENWESLVDKVFYNTSTPTKITKSGVLIVKVESIHLLNFQYETASILKKINALLETKTICKIKIVQKI